MSRTKNYLPVEGPDREAVVDFMSNAPVRDASILMKREGNTLRIIARVCDEGSHTWDEKEMELDLSPQD